MQPFRFANTIIIILFNQLKMIPCLTLKVPIDIDYVEC